MKISEILKQRRFLFSCEFFPPKTEEGLRDLMNAVEEIRSLNPGYVSVTYGAGGSTRDKTVEMVRHIQQEIGIEGMAHLTCVGHSQGEIKSILDQIESAGIENIITLRGDPPSGEKNFVPHPDGFRYASELTRFVRQRYPFCIAVAGYPEGHIESESKQKDWDHLEEKVAFGADFIITQLFFNNKDFFVFEKEMRRRGIQIPIIPGIMPITNFKQIVKFTQLCGARIPERIFKMLEPLQNDSNAIQEIGIQLATEQCSELIDHGVPALHFYTLNKSKSTKKIIENLNSKIRSLGL